MTQIDIEVTFDPPDLPQRMRNYPDKLEREMEQTMKQTLLRVQGSVPQYPSPPSGSSYVRTGTLGRSIGLGGQADIYETRRIGGGYEARLGTRLDYAPYVIGDNEQAWMHKGRWWTLKSVAEKAKPGIERLFEAMSKRLAAFLEGR